MLETSLIAMCLTAIAGVAGYTVWSVFKSEGRHPSATGGGAGDTGWFGSSDGCSTGSSDGGSCGGDGGGGD